VGNNSLLFHTSVANMEPGTETIMKQADRLVLFPFGTEVNKSGHLVIGGCDTVGLAEKFGTPLYIYDETMLRNQATRFKREFGKRYPDVSVLYACKAFLNPALLRIFTEEGLGLDVVSGGEIAIACAAGFPMDRVSFPGNNKSAEELKLALESGVSRIVVDNFNDLKILSELTRSRGNKQDVLIRISPGVDPHTHRYESTGIEDSKFGFPLIHGEDATKTAMFISGLNVVGLHCHIGSQITGSLPYEQAIGIMIDFAARTAQKYDFTLKELSVGGGYPVQYTVDSPVPPISTFAEAITSAVATKCRETGLNLPRLIIEPGRAMVAQAGVALYTVGVIKEIPGIRTYVSVDGGMADDIRPALYQSRTEAVVANRMQAGISGEYTIAGKFCESGDVLIRDIELPATTGGDLLAVPGAGAYNIPQSCNYNAFCRPAVVIVKDGDARLIKRREIIEDLMRCDVSENTKLLNSKC
jgi:diaminopimelate decarboxylase